ncbi:MAG: hypothetical protein ACLVKO_04625 [Dysgonomonas sp.]
MSNLYRIFCVLFFICFCFTIQAQNKGISLEERRSLEEKFKDLKTYAIDDDGTVIFYYQGVENNDNFVTATEESTVKPTVKVRVSVNDSGEYVVTKEEQNELQNIPIQEKPQKETHSYPFMESNNSDKKSSIHESNKNVTAKADVFGRREPTYKTLEEAALAVDNLLDELRKQQNNTSSKKGLSQKLSRGVDGSLRKNSYDLKDEDIYSVTDDNKLSDSNSKYDTEPIYYINGVKSTTEEFKKLKPDEILRKERKRGNNSSGEWWVETIKK